MVKLMLFNREEEYMGDIKNLLSANHIIELNGEDSITFETLDSNIEKGYRIVLHDRDIKRFYEFIVQEKDEYKDSGRVISSIYAENSIVELMGDFIDDKRTINQKADHALSRALESSRWTVEHLDETDTGTAIFYRTNARAAIDTIVDEWLLELETVIKWNKSSKKISRGLRLVKHRGEFRGSRITYTRDILDIKRRTLPGNVITALYGFGKGEETGDGYGRRIDFSSVNNGKPYVENLDAMARWGRLNENGEKVHTFGVEEFDSISDKSRLLERTIGRLGELSKPQVSYEITIVDFFRISDSKQDYLELGDTVKVLDRDFNPAIDYRTRVLRIERDLLDKEQSKIVLGRIVRNIADRDDDKEKELEELEKRLPVYDDAGGENDGTGSLPVYETAGDMIKKYPSLKIGLSSWVDVNEPDSVSSTISGRVTAARDAITNRPVYVQNDVDKSPRLRNMGGRRWLSFTHSPMVLNELKFRNQDDYEKLSESVYGDSIIKSSTPLGDYPVKQDGTFMSNLNNEELIKTAIIVFNDRTDDILEGVDWERAAPNNIFRVGSSAPFGYTHPPIYSYHISYGGSPGKDGLMPSVGYRSSKDYYKRVRDEPVFVFNSYDGEKIENLGLNKTTYSDYIYRSVPRYAGALSFRNTYYQQNAFFEGEISEVILFNRQLDTEEQSLIKDYIYEKYGAMELKK